MESHPYTNLIITICWISKTKATDRIGNIRARSVGITNTIKTPNTFELVWNTVIVGSIVNRISKCKVNWKKAKVIRFLTTRDANFSDWSLPLIVVLRPRKCDPVSRVYSCLDYQPKKRFARKKKKEPKKAQNQICGIEANWELRSGRVSSSEKNVLSSLSVIFLIVKKKKIKEQLGRDNRYISTPSTPPLLFFGSLFRETVTFKHEQSTRSRIWYICIYTRILFTVKYF